MSDFEDRDAIGRLMQISQAKKRTLTADPLGSTPTFIGMELFIEIRVGTTQMKVKSQLVGYISQEYVIIKTPRINGMLANYGTAKTVVVRYMMRGSVYGFQANVLRALGPPFFITFLSYPESIEEVSLRRSPRVDMVIPFDRTGGDPLRESIINLSATGALLKMKEVFKLEDQIAISFVLPNSEPINGIGCIVKRVEIAHDKVLVGVQFEREHPDFTIIEMYVNMALENLGYSEVK